MLEADLWVYNIKVVILYPFRQSIRVKCDKLRLEN